MGMLSNNIELHFMHIFILKCVITMLKFMLVLLIWGMLKTFLS